MLPENAKIARLGGDEFLIVFQEQKRDEVEDLIQRFQRYLLEPHDDKDKIVFSYEISDQKRTVDGLISAADGKMYQRKREEGGFGIMLGLPFFSF